jgi:hypothetical protein
MMRRQIALLLIFILALKQGTKPFLQIKKSKIVNPKLIPGIRQKIPVRRLRGPEAGGIAHRRVIVDYPLPLSG